MVATLPEAGVTVTLVTETPLPLKKVTFSEPTPFCTWITTGSGATFVTSDAYETATLSETAVRKRIKIRKNRDITFSSGNRPQAQITTPG
jgi:hypothetical protein